MNVSLEKVGELSGKIVVNVVKDDYAKEFDKQIPGNHRAGPWRLGFQAFQLIWDEWYGGRLIPGLPQTFGQKNRNPAGLRFSR